MISTDMCKSRKPKENINRAFVIMCLSITFLSIGGCSKSDKSNISPEQPPALSDINDSLKDYRFTRKQFNDPEIVYSFLARLVALYCNGQYQEVAMNTALQRMERSGIEAWLRGIEKSEVVLRELFSDPNVKFEGNKWNIKFNVFRRDGSVETWKVNGTNDPQNEYNQINKIETNALKPKGTFSWPMA